MIVKPFLLYKKSELELVKNTLNNRLNDWVNHWFKQDTFCQVAEIRPVDTPSNISFVGGKYFEITAVENNIKVTCVLSTTSIVGISSLLFGEKDLVNPSDIPGKKTGKLGEKLIIRFLEDLCRSNLLANRKLESVMTESVSHLSTSDDCCKGAVVISITLENTSVDLIVPPEIMEKLIDRPYKSDGKKSLFDKDIKELISIGKVPFETILGSAEVTFEELVSLRVGDVIKIDKKIDMPCSIRFENTTIEYNCVLGKVNGHKAIKIVSHS